MKADLIERSDIYSVTHQEKEYTLYITESNSYTDYQLLDESGAQVQDADFVDEFMDMFWDVYSEIDTQTW